MRTGRHSAKGGYALLAALVAVALVAAGALRVGTQWTERTARENEEELLFVGGQYRDAIAGYYRASPNNAGQFPRTIADILEDRRTGATRRHLRRAWRDPVANSSEWGLERAADGGIAGVFSQSDRQPLKKAGFASADAAFSGSASYRQWKFVFRPEDGMSASAKAP